MKDTSFVKMNAIHMSVLERIVPRNSIKLTLAKTLLVHNSYLLEGGIISTGVICFSFVEGRFGEVRSMNGSSFSEEFSIVRQKPHLHVSNR